MNLFLARGSGNSGVNQVITTESRTVQRFGNSGSGNQNSRIVEDTQVQINKSSLNQELCKEPDHLDHQVEIKIELDIQVQLNKL